MAGPSNAPWIQVAIGPESRSVVYRLPNPEDAAGWQDMILVDANGDGQAETAVEQNVYDGGRFIQSYTNRSAVSLAQWLADARGALHLAATALQESRVPVLPGTDALGNPCLNFALDVSDQTFLVTASDTDRNGELDMLVVRNVWRGGTQVFDFVITNTGLLETSGAAAAAATFFFPVEHRTVAQQ